MIPDIYAPGFTSYGVSFSPTTVAVWRWLMEHGPARPVDVAEGMGLPRHKVNNVLFHNLDGLFVRDERGRWSAWEW